MNRSTTTLLFLLLIPACSGNSSSTSGPPSDLIALPLDNPTVSQVCQSCLVAASGNACKPQATACSRDTSCVSLNDCVNHCSGQVDQTCVNTCEDVESTAARDEWTKWVDSCACLDCMNECSFCTTGSSTGLAFGACQLAPSVPCSSVATGYLCNGSTPRALAPQLTCGAAMNDPSGNLAFCCE